MSNLLRASAAILLTGTLFAGCQSTQTANRPTANHEGYGRFPTDGLNAPAGTAQDGTTLASAEAIDPYADVSFKAIRRNLTPELMTLSERPSDVQRNMAVTGNINLRAMWNDLGRAWMFDQPSILNPYPVYGLSGQPN